MKAVTLTRDLEVFNTNTSSFDIAEIGNRRFMYCPQTGTLILGAEECGAKITLSHAVEHIYANVDEPFDAFIRGWIGVGKGYKNGVIHFAPNVPTTSYLFDAAFFTLKMFRANGAGDKAVVRGFGEVWERKLSDIM